MAPVHNLLQQHYDSYFCLLAGINSELISQEKPYLMAEGDEEEEEGEESHDDDDDDDDDNNNLKGWLQLGIGSRRASGPGNSMSPSSSSSHGRERPSELSLFPERPPLPMITNHVPTNIVHTMNPRSSRSYNFGRFGYQSVEPRSEFRVVRPTQRPQAGVWFELKAAENQGKEPFLPQIPKSYLRIKDGRMTIRVLMKYLANKLSLDDELEVEVTCRGQILHPAYTLQQIRDYVWCTRPTMTMTMTMMHHADNHHLMILHYGRRAYYTASPPKFPTHFSHPS